VNAAVELLREALEWVRNPQAAEELIGYLEKRRALMPDDQQRQRAYSLPAVSHVFETPLDLAPDDGDGSSVLRARRDRRVVYLDRSRSWHHLVHASGMKDSLTTDAFTFEIGKPIHQRSGESARRECKIVKGFAGIRSSDAKVPPR
jgi:hypothetical protein